MQYYLIKWLAIACLMLTGCSVQEGGDSDPSATSNPLESDRSSEGAKGEQGEAGPTGPQGPKGDKGDTGTAGTVGGRGAAGAQGEQGEPGQPVDPNEWYDPITFQTWLIGAPLSEDAINFADPCGDEAWALGTVAQVQLAVLHGLSLASQELDGGAAAIWTREFDNQPRRVSIDSSGTERAGIFPQGNPASVCLDLTEQ